MIKIKNNIDLEELKKFGFINANINDDEECIASNVYCLIEKDNLCFVQNRCVQNHLVEFYFDKNLQFETSCYPEEINWNLVLETIYNLTKADFLEVVQE